MSLWLMGVVFLCYAGVAIQSAVQGSYAWSVVYAGYAFAQVGLGIAMGLTK